MIIYVPKSVTDAVKSRPDWPELEAAMKRAYGDGWRLVSCDEPMHPAEGRRKERKMEVTWIKGHIDPPEAREYYVALEALTDAIPGFSKGDIDITGDYWTGEEWQSLGKNNPAWRVVCWAGILRPNIPDGLHKRVRRYFGFTIERQGE